MAEMARQLHGSLSSYEKVRVVGKGSFGTAYLYKRINDGRLVVMKEILIAQMMRKERLLALNEIRVLSSINHPHIISYYDSFEADGALMIEMEYADGGSLDQYLAQRTRPMIESEILPVLQQLASALDHIHHRDKPILHRDLKPANIFLMKTTGLNVKIGDFGISKMLTTAAMHGNRSLTASTFVGTPFYTSPEIYERKPYDAKSDIWSLGCIVYEMASLRRPFEAESLMSLYKAVVQGRYPPLGSSYSMLFKLLVKDTLQHDPEFRPSAQQILQKRLPQLMASFSSSSAAAAADPQDLVEIEHPFASTVTNAKPKSRSIVYRVDWTNNGGMELTAVKAFPAESSCVQMSVSRTHILFLSSAKQVMMYNLPDGRAIDLADVTLNKQLQGGSIIDLAAGDGFSVFVSLGGIVMTCGIGENGCLGHGNLLNASTPKVVEKLLTVDIKSVACGPSHVVAVARHGTAVFSWGTGPGLGLLSSSSVRVVAPEEMEGIPTGCIVTAARCGHDATLLLTDGPLVLACGDNRSNRLGLNSTAFAFFRCKVSSSSIVASLKPVKLPPRDAYSRVIDASVGRNRSVLLNESGHFIILGDDAGGPLVPATFTWLSLGRPVIGVSCADDVVAAVTADSVYHCWGSIALICEGRSTTLEWPFPSQFLALYASEDQIRKGRIIRPGLLQCTLSGTMWMTVETTASLASEDQQPPIPFHQFTPSF